MDAYGKAGNASRAREVFDEAREAGLADVALYTALLQTYLKAADLTHARAVFHEAERVGRLDERSYRAMIVAFCRARHWKAANRLLLMAETKGFVTARLFEDMIGAYRKAGLSRNARRVFLMAKRHGMAADSARENVARYRRTPTGSRRIFNECSPLGRKCIGQARAPRLATDEHRMLARCSIRLTDPSDSPEHEAPMNTNCNIRFTEVRSVIGQH